MYFPASHLSHSPSFPSTPRVLPRVSEYSPLLSFPHRLDDLGGLLSSSSDPSTQSLSIYLKLFSLILLTVLFLVVTGIFLFHHHDTDDAD